MSHMAAIQNTTGEVSIATYLLTRLEQLGVKRIFGVPGDFNLAFLDVVDDNPEIEWTGNCNELNASHSADGYARVKEGLGVFLTTYGVGELSALNGQAGAFAENVPTLHIVGSPSTVQFKNKPCLHHTLGDGRLEAYSQAAAHFAIAHTEIMDKHNAGAEIDRVLTAALVHARPSYLMLPTDMVGPTISAEALKTPLNYLPPANDPESEEFVIQEINRLVEEAEGDVVVLVDAGAIRHFVRAEVNDFVKRTQFPVYAAPMGKTAVSELGDRYGGVYIGMITLIPEVQEKVESAKLVISIGSVKSDFNTGGFTRKIPTSRSVELHADHTAVQHARFNGIRMKHLLPKLAAALESRRERAMAIPVTPFRVQVPQEENKMITHSWLWPRVSQFFRPRDVIVGESGTSVAGLIDTPLPEDSVFISQFLFGSIGWTVGSTLGAGLAARDRKLGGRTILFIGDGSLQLTAQEISPMLRMKLNPIIFVINNKGYTVERLIHGPTRAYNDVDNWRYSHLLDTFGGEEGVTSESRVVSTKAELDALLNSESFARADKAQLVEIIAEKMDAPQGLINQTSLLAKANKHKV